MTTKGPQGNETNGIAFAAWSSGVLENGNGEDGMNANVSNPKAIFPNLPDSKTPSSESNGSATQNAPEWYPIPSGDRK
jgi:hypothetical protein